MNGYISEIDTTIPHTSRKVKVDLQGKNLILTGGNGCGKTQILSFLYKRLEQQIVNRETFDIHEVQRDLERNKTNLDKYSPADNSYDYYKNKVAELEEKFELIQSDPIKAKDLQSFAIKFHEQKSLLLFFEATRQANINESVASASKEDLIKEETRKKLNQNSSDLFERFLVSHKTSQAYATSFDNNQEEANKIQAWFDKLEGDLRKLFEDKSLKLVFDTKKQCFFIHQEFKEPYRFQKLSSGFSSILSVYADLLTKIELRDISPNEIDGIVFIDEIDAHLHVSIQGKILSFLSNAFPKIQFIITTHSPFVVSSVSDAVIYDLSRLEQVEDLSMYSYESIIEGLFGITPISEILKQKIIELTNLSKKESPDFERMEELITEIRPNEAKLDSESSYFYENAKLIINKRNK